MAFSAEFTDAQGTHFSAAHFEVSSAHLQRSSNENVYKDPSSQELVSESTKTSNLNYQMFYWISEQHKLDGKLPYLLKTEGGTNFSENNLGPEYDNLDAEACAYLHCQNWLAANQ